MACWDFPPWYSKAVLPGTSINTPLPEVPNTDGQVRNFLWVHLILYYRSAFKRGEIGSGFPDALVYVVGFALPFLLFNPTGSKCLPPPSSRTSPLSNLVSGCTPPGPHSDFRSWTTRRRKSRNGLSLPTPNSTKTLKSTLGIGLLSFLRPGLRLDPLLDCGMFHISFRSTILGH